MYKHEILNDLGGASPFFYFVENSTEVFLGDGEEFVGLKLFDRALETFSLVQNKFYDLRAPFKYTLFTGVLATVPVASVVCSDVRNRMVAYMFIKPPKPNRWMSTGCIYYIDTGDKEGLFNHLNEKSGVKFSSMNDTYKLEPKENNGETSRVMSLSSDRAYTYVYCALYFLSCKNVHLESRSPVQISAAKRMTIKSKHRSLPLEYHTIVIDGIGKEKGGTLGIGTQEQRLHICRGHFSIYTEERKLFGKYTGRYWIPAHVRGNPELGTIEKDYEVKYDQSH